MNSRSFTYLCLALDVAALAAGVSLTAAQAAAPARQGPPVGPPSATSPAPASPKLAPPAPVAPNVVLYDQYNNAGANGTNSQQYERDFNTYTDYAADDFTVPAGQIWLVNEIDVAGQYAQGNGPAAAFNVFFYQNDGTLPGTRIYSVYGLSYTGGPPDFVIPLPNPAYLAGGSSYWVSVQADMNFSLYGRWNWTDRTVLSGNPAAWMSDGGWGLCGFQQWRVRTDCVGDPGAPDQVFRLMGTTTVQNTPTATVTIPAGGTATPTPTCEPVGTPGPWTTVTPYPQTISRYGFAEVGNDFYVISGVSNFSDVTTVRKYNTATGLWTDLAGIPEGSPAPAAAYYNGRIYVASSGSHTFQIYDLAANAWLDGPHFPGGHGGDGAAAGAWNGNVYVVGGGAGDNTETWVYNIAANTWTFLSYAPVGYNLGGYHQAGQYLYMVGSYGDTLDTNSTTTMRFDMAARTFSIGPTWTMQRADFGLAYDPIANKLIAIGGDMNGGGAFDTAAEVDELSLASWPGGAWVVSPPALPAPRQGNQAGFYGNGGIYSVGGTTAGLTFTADTFYRTQPSTCAGTTATPTAPATATATATAEPPTNTPLGPTTTPVPPTATVQASVTRVPSATSVPPSLTPVPPTASAAASSTGVPATATAIPCTITFTDVQPTDYFYEPVRYLYCQGVISGYADNTFRPYNTTTRGQIAKMIVLAAGFSLVLPPGAPHFSDVPPSNPFYSYIEAAYAHGIISGYTDGTFRGNVSVTRAQITKMTVVARGLALSNPSAATFDDVPPAYWAYQYIETAVAHNVIAGYGCGGPGEPCPGRYFRPDNDVTRGQLSKILYQTFAMPAMPGGGARKP